VSEAHHIVVEQREWAKGLPRGVVQEVQAATDGIHALTRTTAESIYRIGEYLVRVKKVLRNHGEKFMVWLKEEFTWTDRTARRMMEVATNLRKPIENGQIVHYAPSALYALAAESTPEEVRQEAEKLAASGKKVTNAGVQEMREKHEAVLEAFDGLTPDQQEEIDAKATALAEEEEDGEPADRWHDSATAYLDSLDELFGERGLKKPDAKKAAACFRSLRKLAAKYA
jgi:hypothetical protein